MKQEQEQVEERPRITVMFEELTRRGRWMMMHIDGEFVIRHNFHMESVPFGFSDEETWSNTSGQTIIEALENVKPSLLNE